MRLALFGFALAATLLPAVGTALAADSMTLASHYDVAGTNPNGSAYSGTATVNVISDTTFTIKWNIAGSVYEGFGMRLNDTLSATYTIDGEPGLVMYKVDADGIKGLWAIRGHNGSGTEQLKPRD